LLFPAVESDTSLVTENSRFWSHQNQFQFSTSAQKSSQKQNQFQFSLMSVRVADGAMRSVLHQS
jgi:hypothetical protein